MRSVRRPLLIVALWAAGALLFAGQWSIYDATRHAAEPFPYYLGWSLYLWGMLTPLALWLGRRWPIDSRVWKRTLTLHLAASLVLTAAELFIESSIGWLRHGDLTFQQSLRHYFSQHTQVSLLIYWALIAGMKFYAINDQSQKRRIRAAQLEAQLAEAQLQALRGQLQPHFLFNTLQAATTLIYEDPAGAEEVLVSLSELLRLSLGTLREDEVPLREDLAFLEHYLAIQRRRFGERLQFEIEIDPKVRDVAVPSLLLQPIVENAVRHGIGKHRGPDVISIRAYGDDSRLHLEIRNRNSVLEDGSPRVLDRGLGLSSTIARLDHLYGDRQSLEVRALHPRGVLVAMSFPARVLARSTVAAAGRETG